MHEKRPANACKETEYRAHLCAPLHGALSCYYEALSCYYEALKLLLRGLKLLLKHMLLKHMRP
jgi:hypothetical protein